MIIIAQLNHFWGLWDTKKKKLSIIISLLSCKLDLVMVFLKYAFLWTMQTEHFETNILIRFYYQCKLVHHAISYNKWSSATQIIKHKIKHKSLRKVEKHNSVLINQENNKDRLRKRTSSARSATLGDTSWARLTTKDVY